MVIDLKNGDGFGLIMSPDGALGIAGLAKFQSDEEVESTLADIVKQIRDGWEFIKSRKK